MHGWSAYISPLTFNLGGTVYDSLSKGVTLDSPAQVYDNLLLDGPAGRLF